MKRPSSPTIKQEVRLAQRVKQEGGGAGSGAGAATALMPALVAVKQEMGADSGQPAVNPAGVLPAQVPVGNTQTVEAQLAELRQLVQSQGKQLQSQAQQIESQKHEINVLKKEITGLKESKIEIKQFPEGTYRGPLVNGKATGHGVLTYKMDNKF